MASNFTFDRRFDEVAIIAPSSGCHEAKSKLLAGRELLGSHGFKCKYNQNILSGHPGLGYFASAKEQRSLELQEALLDPKVGIIWAFRGGYGASEIVFDFIYNNLIPYNRGTALKKTLRPKILIGFSDITVLLLLWQRLKMPAIHASVITSLTDRQPAMLEQIIAVLSGKAMSLNLVPMNDKASLIGSNDSELKGEITGGNLTVICHMIGSKLTLKTKDRIIFLEDVNEKGYHVHRHLLQMKHAGLFDGVKALILGDFADSDDRLDSSLADFCATHLLCPAFRASGIGHMVDNYPIVMDADSQIKNNNLVITSPFKLI